MLVYLVKLFPWQQLRKEDGCNYGTISNSSPFFFFLIFRRFSFIVRVDIQLRPGNPAHQKANGQLVIIECTVVVVVFFSIVRS